MGPGCIEEINLPSQLENNASARFPSGSFASIIFQAERLQLHRPEAGARGRFLASSALVLWPLCNLSVSLGFGPEWNMELHTPAMTPSSRLMRLPLSIPSFPLFLSDVALVALALVFARVAVFYRTKQRTVPTSPRVPAQVLVNAPSVSRLICSPRSPPPLLCRLQSRTGAPLPSHAWKCLCPPSYHGSFKRSLPCDAPP